MALFTNLYHPGEALAHLIRTRLSLASGDVIAGAPRDTITSTTKHLRVTLLWTSEIPTHRNDPPERNLDGTLTPPPLSLSAFYLLTAYGDTVQEELIGAHEILGDALRVIHDEPELSLPFGDLPGRGDGKLGLSLVPLSHELVEKLFGPLQIKHRPFALLEIGPVQLTSLKDMLAARPVVAPGGLKLAGPTKRPRPVLQRAVPVSQSVGGRIRLDGVFADPPTQVWIGSTKIDSADILVIDEGASISVVIPAVGPDAVSEGGHNISVTAGELSSDSTPIRVLPASEPTIDAPAALSHSKADDLIFSGRGLTGTLDIIAWPDRGVSSPLEVVTLPLAVPASDTQMTVAAASLAALSERSYRFAARVGASRFTPHIVLEVTP